MNMNEERRNRFEEEVKKEYVDKNPSIFEEEFDKWCIDSKDRFESRKYKENYKKELEMVRTYKNVPNHKPYSKKWIFNNGYGISVIRKNGSYGFENELFETAIVSCGTDELDIETTLIDNNTPITSNNGDIIIPNLTSVKVLKIGAQVWRLPPKDFGEQEE